MVNYIGAGMEIEQVSGTETQRTIYYPAGGAFRVIVASPASNTLYYRHGDHLGSTSVLSDSTGAKVSGSEVVYAPFGVVRTGSESNLTDFGYTGQRHDDSTGGLMYYGARYYLPGLMRFISTDTIVPSVLNPQALNRYSYVQNHPINFNDPTGHTLNQPMIDGEFATAGAAKTQAKAKANNPWKQFLDNQAKAAQYGVFVTVQRDYTNPENTPVSAAEAGTASQVVLDTIRTIARKTKETIDAINAERVNGGQSPFHYGGTASDAFKAVFGPTVMNVCGGEYLSDCGWGGKYFGWNQGKNSRGVTTILMSLGGFFNFGDPKRPEQPADAPGAGPTWIAHELGHNVTNRGIGFNDYSPGPSYTGPEIWNVILPQSGRHGEGCGSVCERTGDVISAWALDSYNPFASQEDVAAARADIGDWMTRKITNILEVSQTP